MKKHLLISVVVLVMAIPLEASGAAESKQSKGDFSASKKIYAAIAKGLNRLQEAKGNIRIFNSPNARQDQIKVAKYGIDVAARYWSDIYHPVKPIPAFFLTPKDGKWLSGIFPKYSEDKEYLPYWNKNISGQDGRYQSADSGFNSKDLSAYMVFTNGKDFQENFGTKQVAAHEYTHNVQHQYRENPNCWMKEGEAHFYSMVLINKNVDEYIDLRKDNFLGTPEAQTSLPTKVNWVEFFKKAEEGGFNCASGGVYDAGSLAYEYLFLKGGKAATVAFWKEFEKTQNYDQAFLKIYGKKTAQLYPEFGKYIDYQVAQLRKR